MISAVGRRIYLCGGTQCSGSSLISCASSSAQTWMAFSMRAFDTLPSLPTLAPSVLPWCKFTIACFRFSEVYDYFADDGWDIAPLLVVRDVRSVFNSLSNKRIGMNGTTAEEPPLRVRLMRFREDWRMFRQRGWPVLRYESFVASPEQELQKTCTALGVPWDQAMVSWPKQREEIADSRYGSRVLHDSRGASLHDSLRTDRAAVETQNILSDDFAWLEREFAEFNLDMQYPEHVDYVPPAQGECDRLVPCYENTRRYWREARKGPVRKTLRSIARVFENIGDHLHRAPERPANVGMPKK